MFIPFLIIISILSFFPIWEKIWNFLMKQRKNISIFLYILCFFTFFILATDISIHNTWEYSIWLLWIILLLPILSKVGNLAIPKKLMIFRKEIWILMWVMAFIHSLQYFIEPYSYMPWELNFWFLNWSITYLAWWMLALIITVILTITSNNFSIKKLWKSWKFLHRTVYILIIFTLLHVSTLKIANWHWWDNALIIYLENFIPFLLYFIWKILEWKKIKLRK